MIAVIADDFTGAAEIGGVGLKYGLKVVIETEVKENGLADVLIIAADTRSLPSLEAAKEIESITRKLLKLNPQYIYKKLDSVLRGNISDELIAQLKATGKQKAIVIAANPEFGRIIENGHYTVNNVPLAETSFADDPDFPIQSSNVKEIVGLSAVPVYSLPVSAVLQEEGIIIGDVKNTHEMQLWVDKDDDSAMLAGGAGFFDALIGDVYHEVSQKCDGCLELGANTLFIYGSKFPKSRKLPMGLMKEETLKLNMPDAIYRDRDFNVDLMKQWVDEVIRGLELKKKVIITIEQGFSEEEGLSGRIRKNVAELVRQVAEKRKLSDLLIEGGASTSAILKAMGIDKLYPDKLINSGIIQMKPDGFSDLTITTKPGSYPWPENVIVGKNSELKTDEA